MTKVYWQIPLEEKSRPYTAFATPIGPFQFIRMTFGLHGAAATFQRLVDYLLSNHSAYAAAYINDIVVFSDSWEDHLVHLKVIIREIKLAGLTINPEKCKIGVQPTQYLGFIVGGGHVEPILSKSTSHREDSPTHQPKGDTMFFRYGGVLLLIYIPILRKGSSPHQ